MSCFATTEPLYVSRFVKLSFDVRFENVYLQGVHACENRKFDILPGVLASLSQ